MSITSSQPVLATSPLGVRKAKHVTPSIPSGTAPLPGITPLPQITTLDDFSQNVRHCAVVIGKPVGAEKSTLNYVPIDSDITTEGEVVTGLHERLQEGTVNFAKDKGGRPYYVSEELFDHPDHARDIYRFERDSAISNINNYPHYKAYPLFALEQKLFEEIEKIVLTSNSISTRRMRHYSFMLKIASEVGCGYITASAILLHSANHPYDIAREALRNIENQKGLSKAERESFKLIINNIVDTVTRFQEMNAVLYRPSGKKQRLADLIVFMHALIKISRGNWKALLILLTHKLSSLIAPQKDSDHNDISAIAIDHIYAPLAERFGMIDLAEQLRDQAFRLYQGKLYYKYEREIIGSLAKKSRREAKVDLDQIKRLLEELQASAGNFTFKYEICYVKTNLKRPWSAYIKSKFKSEDYSSDDQTIPGVLYLEDKYAGRVVTKDRITLGQALEMVEFALSGNSEKDISGIFSKFNYANQQTEEKTKKFKVGNVEINVKVVHVGVILKDKNSLELQFVSEKDMHQLEFGCFAHWMYNLKKLLTKHSDKQAQKEFDADMRSLQECSQVMIGDLEHDVGAVYKWLKNELYVFAEGPAGSVQPVHLKQGAKPTDAFEAIKNGNNARLESISIGKIWNGLSLQASPNKPLEDGDFIRFRTQPDPRIAPISPKNGNGNGDSKRHPTKGKSTRKNGGRKK